MSLRVRSSSLATFAAITLAALSAAFATGCAGDDGQISLDTTNASLTDKPNDFLFAVKVDDARSEGYDVAGVSVKVTLKDKAPIALVCTVKDANTNGKLERGESLSCDEGDKDVFNPAAGIKDATVELFAKIDGKDERVGDASWTPK